MRRAASVLGGLFLLIAVSVVPVAADTGGGGNFYELSSFTSTCSVSGGRTTCTSTSLDAFTDSTGQPIACFEYFTYSIDQKGNFKVINQESGCAPAASFTITSGLVATLGATQIALQSCDRHGCTTTQTVTVSASDSPSGPITTTTGKITTTSGGCTTRTSFTDKSADVAGTFTVDGITSQETGSVLVHTETSKTTCH